MGADELCHPCPWYLIIQQHCQYVLVSLTMAHSKMLAPWKNRYSVSLWRMNPGYVDNVRYFLLDLLTS